jgi:hypothetical protein
MQRLESSWKAQSSEIRIILSFPSSNLTHTEDNDAPATDHTDEAEEEASRTSDDTKLDPEALA